MSLIVCCSNAGYNGDSLSSLFLSIFQFFKITWVIGIYFVVYQNFAPILDFFIGIHLEVCNTVYIPASLLSHNFYYQYLKCVNKIFNCTFFYKLSSVNRWLERLEINKVFCSLFKNNNNCSLAGTILLCFNGQND